MSQTVGLEGQKPGKKHYKTNDFLLLFVSIKQIHWFDSQKLKRLTPNIKYQIISKKKSNNKWEKKIEKKIWKKIFQKKFFKFFKFFFLFFFSNFRIIRDSGFSLRYAKVRLSFPKKYNWKASFDIHLKWLLGADLKILFTFSNPALKSALYRFHILKVDFSGDFDNAGVQTVPIVR